MPPRPTNAFLEFGADEIEQSIPARFARQVARHPGRRAVKDATHDLTYAELDRLAERIARAVAARPGRPDEPVALLLEHGAPFVAAILGVLRAGRIYLPLDPTYPPARSRYILEDAGAALLVTGRRHRSRAAGLSGGAMPLLDIDELEPLPPGRLDFAVPPDAPAWILYTSGSTGRPKGVVQSHRNVLWDVREYTNTLHISPDDRMTLLYSCSVNGAVRGIFGPLLNGASLYPLDIRDQGLNGLAELLLREEITIFHSVPSVFRHFAETLTGDERFPALRVVRFGGERVLAGDVEAYRRHFPDGCLLYTGMGATETGHVRHHFLDRHTPVAAGVVPAGYPVEGKEVLLFDAEGREVAPGATGEIVVRSRYLALGYWRRPDLTRARFLEDPAGGPERVFRTGDLGRLQPDGCLEHLGRTDFQVKVRGWRIETGEIETALLGIAGVRDAVVVAREETPGDGRLIAYVVPVPGQRPVPGGLRAHLETVLPGHMVPSAFVLLDTLPLTPNGKVDRQALPAPDLPGCAPDRSDAPSTPAEAALPMCRDVECARLLPEWNATERAYPRHATLSQLYEAQADETPEAVAVVFGDERLTYRELDLRSGRLASHLRALGVGPEVRVGVALERSSELVVALLGVLKAGGAYVPLDPAYPRARLAFMLADAGVSVLVTEERFEAHLGARDLRVVRLDADRARIAAASSARLASGAGAESLAYVTYTSGSTGVPKGVAVPHRAVVRLVRETGYARLAPDEVFLQLAPIAFDAATFEIWGALLNGARLVVAPAHALSLAELGRTLRRHGVTTLWLTAGLFRRMVDEQLGDLRGVRQLLAGGDVLPLPQVRRVLRELPGCRLINGYGPTEATTFTCCHPAPRPLPDSCESLPIGAPIANTRVYVLDRFLGLVPVGVPGELYIGGDGLARGYLGRPGLTAEHFVPDPFGPEPGARLYRTGDRVRWLPEGVLEFLGRIDGQVKIRGYRIEPAEVEAALVEHPAVGAAAVIPRDDRDGEKHLVACVVPSGASGGGPPSAGELRQFLQGRLPDHMVPSAFVRLDALPLTVSGKVDRAALVALAPAAGPARERETEYVAPRTPAEAALAEIWGEVLGTGAIGAHDNFFASGGHSLLGTRVVARIRARLGVDLPLRLLFEHPTVAGLAGALEGVWRAAAAGSAPPAPVAVPRVPRAAVRGGAAGSRTPGGGAG